MSSSGSSIMTSCAQSMTQVFHEASLRTMSSVAANSGRFLFCLCLLILAQAIAGCASSPDSFEEHRRQAVKDSRSPEARAYERALYPSIGQDMADLLKKCTTEFPAAEIDSFEMVFRIDHWGEPKAILVKPATEVSECVAKGFWYFAFPHPDERFAKTGLVLLLPISIK